MRKLTFLFAVAISFFVLSCNDDEAKSSTDYIIFGHHYGFCQGADCLKYFKLDTEHVYEYADTCLPIPVSSCYEANPPMLSDAKFEIAKSLFDDFPEALFDETEMTLGCPDCADQGGLYLEIKRGDAVNSWNIDQSKSAIPAYLHDYVDELNQVIEEM